MLKDTKGNLWIGTDAGLYCFNGKTNGLRLFRHTDADASSLIDNLVKVVFEDSEKNIWVGTQHGLSMLLPGMEGFQNFQHSNAGFRTLSSNIINSVAEDTRNKKLWIGTMEGLDVFDLKNKSVERITPNDRKSFGLTRKSVRTIYIDNAGIFWVGTYQGGINKYDRSLSLFQLRGSNKFDRNGLSSPIVTSFAEDNSGGIFIGTDGGGLNKYDSRTELFSHIAVPCAGQNSSRMSILAMKMDHKERLWVGTFSNGLFCLDLTSGVCKQFTKGINNNSINNNDIYCVNEDKKGNILIGTNGGGLNIYTPGGQFHSFSDKPASAQNSHIPFNSYIRAVEEGGNGILWIGSYGGGIASLDIQTGACHVFNKDNSNLKSNFVYTILRDSRNNIWIGTAGSGLSYFDHATNTIATFSANEGLPNAVVYKIIEGRDGLIWLSTNVGISSFNPQSKRFTNYNHNNGVQSNNFVPGSGVRRQNGDIYFGGLEGFNFFNPGMFHENNSKPSVVLTNLQVNNRAVQPSPKGPLLEQISIAKEIFLDYKQSFSISFTALDYSSDQQNRYAYKLDRFDNEWVDAGNSKTAYYTNLYPGKYTFRVRLRKSDGAWDTKETSIIIHINPPFWLTIYAYIFYIGIIMAVFLFYRHKTLQKLQRKFAAEQEKLRVEQLLSQQRDEAANARRLDQMKIKFLTNLSHEFRTPISLILGPVDKLRSRTRDPFTADQLNMVHRNARRLLNLVNQLLDLRKLEENELTIFLEKGDLVIFIKDVFDSFKELAGRKNIDYSFHADLEKVYVPFDQGKLESILFNLLSNAFKFTTAGGHVSLGIEKKQVVQRETNSEIWLSVSIADSGIGIAAPDQEKIFDRFFQISNPSLSNHGSGIGLSITHELVKILGGTIAVESKLGQGSVFTVQLPFAVCAQPDTAEGQKSSPEIANVPLQVGENNEERGKRTKKPVVLLVEDDDDFRIYLKEQLEEYYKVVESCNGKEGWQKALSQHPELVVSDVNMPFMNGMEFSTKLKSDKRTSHIPVILLTAVNGENEQIKGLAAGANDYVTKPFNFDILNAKIKNLLFLNLSSKSAYSKQIKVDVPQKEIESADSLLIKEIRLYIEDHISDQQLSVEQLSKKIGMSRSSFYSKMLDLTGQTPVEYIRSVKLEKAALLLEKSDLNVAQVAYETGFATPNYFAKSFKAVFSMLPSEYMGSKRKNDNR